MEDFIKKLVENKGEWLDKFVKHDTKVERDYSQRRADAYEGKVPKSSDNPDNAETIKTLTEAFPEDKEDEEQLGRAPEKPDKEPERSPENDDEEGGPENEKEYFGKKEDVFYYLKKQEEGEPDLLIVDAEGQSLFSASENEIDTSDIFHFILAAVPAVEPSEVSADIFMRYIKPKVEELEHEDEEFEPDMDADNVLSPEKPKSPFESKLKFSFNGLVFEADASAEGTNTVLEIKGKKFTFNEDFSSFFKKADNDTLTDDGVVELAMYILGSLDEAEQKLLAIETCDTDDKLKGKGKKKKEKEGPLGESKEDIKEINVVTQGIRQLKKASRDAFKAGDFASAAEFATNLATIHGALPDIPEPEEPTEAKEEEKGTDEIIEPAEADEGKVVKNPDSTSEKETIDKLTEDDEVIIPEKKVKEKTAPHCDKCGKSHWPFHGCGKKDDKEPEPDKSDADNKDDDKEEDED